MSARDLLVEGAPGIVRINDAHVHVKDIKTWKINDDDQGWLDVFLFKGGDTVYAYLGDFSRAVAIANYEARTGHRVPEDFGEVDKYAEIRRRAAYLPEGDLPQIIPICPECNLPIEGQPFASKEHGRDVCFPCCQKLNVIRRDKDKKEKEASNGEKSGAD